MNNFLRVVRLALRYRGTLIAAFFTSLAVGVLWGANIGAVYPFVQVVFRGQSLHQWIDTQVDTSQASIVDLETQLKTLRDQRDAAAPDERSRTDREIEFLAARLKAERQALNGFGRLRPYIHAWAPDDPFQTLVLVVLALVVATIVKDACIVANLMLVERVVQLTTFDLRKQFFRQTLRLDVASFGEGHDSELLSRFTYDMGAVGGGLNNLFGRLIREPLKMAACLIAASWISWRLLLFSLLISPPAILLMRILARAIKRASRRAMEEMSQLYNTLTEAFGGIQTVKAFTMEPFERNRFHLAAKQFYRRAMRIAFYNSLTKPVTEMLGIGVISLALTAGAYLVLEHETHLLGIKLCDRPMEIGMLLLFYGMLVGVTDPARKLSEVIGAVQNGVAAADRIYALMDREPTITDPPNPRSPASPHRRLVIEHVDFQYQPGRPVLQDVALEIPFGRTVAFVGPNGCGKSTLMHLVSRFYDPTAGAVRLDDVDLRDMRPRELRMRIGLVTQQTHLFDDTVMSNIRYGSPQASDDDVVAAARRAHAHHFITEKLPQGYDTVVGQGGKRLSGGQRQRIALARAILRDPEILILDEATSQIDIESEQAIHRALAEFARGRTALMITHRLSTLTLADEIVVMDAGQVIDRGRHDELLARCTTYRKLNEIHFRQSA